MRKGVIWPHKRENNREIGLLLVSPAYSTMKSTAARSWKPMKKTPDQHFRITISDLTGLEAFTNCK